MANANQNLTAYACMNGHVIYCEDNLSTMICPLCLGKPKDTSLNIPWQLSVVQVNE